MRSRYKITGDGKIFFITSTIVEWIPVFTSENYFNILTESMNYCVKNKNLKIYSYVILDNHFHMITSGHELSKTIASIKRHTAKKVIEKLKFDNRTWLLNQLSFYKKSYKKESTYQIWQESFHPQEIISDDMMKQKIEYIHYNPVKRGFIDKPECWIYSSARDYMTEEKGPVEIEMISI